MVRATASPLDCAIRQQKNKCCALSVHWLMSGLALLASPGDPMDGRPFSAAGSPNYLIGILLGVARCRISAILLGRICNPLLTTSCVRAVCVADWLSWGRVHGRCQPCAMAWLDLHGSLTGHPQSALRSFVMAARGPFRSHCAYTCTLGVILDGDGDHLETVPTVIAYCQFGPGWRGFEKS